ncbi:hypothetical protein GOP47_0003073 [Adiantum capillus-veneris]|uniref:Uncharacterized protein n=1 Tax=Adiantum capillus-veneris TaxID=13818 RepID=A0A9D4VC45_ADICA|nr:hypothetical protein GOP47_0003073 [Adiantum capillus-veneris]
MSYWKTKVVPKFKKFFDKGKKKAASDACKSFDSSKESLDKEIEEKRSDLHPKVIEVYRSSTIITKKLLKEPNEPAVKENPDAIQSVLADLAKAGFPQAQFLCDAGGKCGPALLPGPIVYLFQKTSTFLVEEPLPEPAHETREIMIEGGEPSKAEETKEPDVVPESTTAEPTLPPPMVEEKQEEKKEVIPIEAKKEEVAAVEVKKEEAAPVESKKEVVAPVEIKAEVVPLEATKDVPPVVEKKEEVAPVKEEKKEAAPIKEEKKEEAVVAPTSSEAKKEDAPKVEEKKEKPVETPPSVGEK